MTSPFAGKTPQERNKMIVAGVLGLISLVALYMAFGRSFFGSSATTVTVKSSPSPTPRNTQPTGNGPTMPTRDEQLFTYETTEIAYRPGAQGGTDAGRNIFAFYEPPPPCDPKIPGDCPIPTPKPSPPVIVPTPTPIPTPPIQLAGLTPSSVYAGEKSFKMEVIANGIPQDAKVYFNRVPVNTMYVASQKVVAEIPLGMITAAGTAQVTVQTANGVMYSNALPFQIMVPPKPQVQYIGMISRARHNNDTAYLINASASASPTSLQNAVPFGARLNDVIQSRFRLVDITPAQVTFEDTSLGFRHKIPINKTIVPSPGSTGPAASNPGFPQFPNQGVPQQITIGPDGIPIINGVPINIPQPQPNQTPPN